MLLSTLPGVYQLSPQWLWSSNKESGGDVLLFWTIWYPRETNSDTKVLRTDFNHYYTIAIGKWVQLEINATWICLEVTGILKENEEIRRRDGINYSRVRELKSYPGPVSAHAEWVSCVFQLMTKGLQDSIFPRTLKVRDPTLLDNSISNQWLLGSQKTHKILLNCGSYIEKRFTAVSPFHKCFKKRRTQPSSGIK